MKKFFKTSGLVLAFLFVKLAALSATPLDFDNSVGVFALADTNVMGIQYQRWCTEKIGFQTEGFVVYNDSAYTSSNFDCSLSCELHLKLFEAPFGKKSGSTLYAWFLGGYHGKTGNEYIASKGTWGEPDYVEGYYEPTGYLSNAILGLGFGFDIMFLNHISIPIQFGFSGEFPNTKSAGFCLGAGVRYRF